MDPLLVIVAILSAIIFTWVGYFLGNILPMRGKKQSDTRIEIPQTETQSVTSFVDKVMGFLFGEREDDAPDDAPEDAPDDAYAESLDDTPEIDQAPEKSQGSPKPEESIPLRRLKEMTHLWYDRLERKLYAEFDGEGVDLDKRLTPDQHSRLSFLLLDLQDKVGISAALRSIIQEREGDAFPQKDEGEVVRQPFNPMRSFINYVQSDVPKLEDKVDSIPVQINEILQRKLKGTPFEKHGVSIGEWPERGVVFIVGVDVYSDIHEIPDPNIRLYIQEAVKEWDNKENDD